MLVLVPYQLCTVCCCQVATQYERLTQFQRLLFKHHPSLKELALSNCGTLQKRSVLKPALEGLPQEELKKLATSQLRSCSSLPASALESHATCDKLTYILRVYNEQTATAMPVSSAPLC